MCLGAQPSLLDPTKEGSEGKKLSRITRGILSGDAIYLWSEDYSIVDRRGVRRTNCTIAVTAWLLATLAFLSAPGMANLTLMAFADCGPLAPHDHVLLGGADQNDLRQHLAAEAACKLDAPGPVAGGIPRAASRKEVLPVTRAGSGMIMSGVGQPRLAETAIAAPRCPGPIVSWQMSRSLTLGCSTSVPPLTPPPRAA